MVSEWIRQTVQRLRTQQYVTIYFLKTSWYTLIQPDSMYGLEGSKARRQDCIVLVQCIEIVL